MLKNTDSIYAAVMNLKQPDAIYRSAIWVIHTNRLVIILRACLFRNIPCNKWSKVLNIFSLISGSTERSAPSSFLPGFLMIHYLVYLIMFKDILIVS